MSPSPAAAFIFDQPTYVRARESRLRCLFAAAPPESFAGKRVLELGAGTGDLGYAFEQAGASVCSVDAVPAYVREISRRYPRRAAVCADLEAWLGTEFGQFDIVVSFGVLYHLSQPERFLRASLKAAPLLFLETVVCDRLDPVCVPVEEEGPDQAYSRQGCRPSPSWIVNVCNSVKREVHDISSPLANWEGAPGSVFDWECRDNWEWLRDGRLLRRMYRVSVPPPVT